MTRITYETLRQRGFRITSTNVSDVPHMTFLLDRRMDTALEIAPSYRHATDWCVWLRSDLAHSRCRFCYLRNVSRMEQVEALAAAIMDEPLPVEEIDVEQFAESLERERADCTRRYAEYCRNERWSYVPG